MIVQKSNIRVLRRKHDEIGEAGSQTQIHHIHADPRGVSLVGYADLRNQRTSPGEIQEMYGLSDRRLSQLENSYVGSQMPRKQCKHTKRRRSA